MMTRTRATVVVCNGHDVDFEWTMVRVMMTRTRATVVVCTVMTRLMARAGRGQLSFFSFFHRTPFFSVRRMMMQADDDDDGVSQTERIGSLRLGASPTKETDRVPSRSWIYYIRLFLMPIIANYSH